MPTAHKTASFGFASESIAAYEAAISRGSPTNTLEGLRTTAMNAISTLSSSKAVRAWDRMDELDALWGRKTAGLVQVVQAAAKPDLAAVKKLEGVVSATMKDGKLVVVVQDGIGNSVGKVVSDKIDKILGSGWDLDDSSFYPSGDVPAGKKNQFVWTAKKTAAGPDLAALKKVQAEEGMDPETIGLSTAKIRQLEKQGLVHYDRGDGTVLLTQEGRNMLKGKTASSKTALRVDLVPLARSLKAKAVVVARVLLAKDLRTASFMQMHAARTGDPAAQILASVLIEEMPAGRRASAERLAGGLYGFPTRTARLGLAACAELTARAGELTFRAHATHQAFHRPMTATLARSKDPTARLLLASYPQDKKAGEAPEHLKEHQFTEEDNPNPKGNDADGDGKSFEKKPDFLKEKGKDKKAGFDAEEIGEEGSGPVQTDKGESFMKGHFTQESFSGMEAEFGKSASTPRTVKGWLEWEPD